MGAYPRSLTIEDHPTSTGRPAEIVAQPPWARHLYPHGSRRMDQMIDQTTGDLVAEEHPAIIGRPVTAADVITRRDAATVRMILTPPKTGAAEDAEAYVITDT